MSDDNFERLRVVPRAERVRQAESYESESRFKVYADDSDDEDFAHDEVWHVVGMVGVGLLFLILLVAVAVGGFALGVSYESLHASN